MIKRKWKLWLPFLMLTLTMVAVAGCGSGKDSSLTDNFVAQETADASGNTENGLTQELGDLTGLIPAEQLSGENQVGQQTITAQASYTIVVEAGLSGFTEKNDANGWYYERNLSGQISSEHYSGTINSCQIVIRFYDNPAGSGSSLKAGQSGGRYTLPTAALLIRYNRKIDTAITNDWRNITRALKIETNITITEFKDGLPGVKVTGERSETVHVANGFGLWYGDWKLDFTNIALTAYRDNLGGGTVYTTCQGSTDIHYTGTLSGTKGSKTVDVTGTIQFNRQRTVTVSLNGETASIDIVTGKVE